MTGTRDVLFSNAATEGREQSHERHTRFSLNVIYEDGREGGVLYGLMLSAPLYLPERGVQFVFDGWYLDAWDAPQEGVFLVTIHGRGIRDVSHHLKAGKLDFIRVGDSVTGYHVRKLK